MGRAELHIIVWLRQLVGPPAPLWAAVASSNAVLWPPCNCLQRCRRVARGDAVASLPAGCQLSLYVRWHSAAGAVKVNRLPLDPIGGVEDLRGLFRCGGRAVDACNLCEPPLLCSG